MKRWIRKHPRLWEFILFNVLSNCATITNFVVMWICTFYLFKELKNQPFQFWFFDYSAPESLGLCGFLSFLFATALAQAVNFYVQKNHVFKSNTAFRKAIPKYICLVVILMLISTILPAYSQKILSETGMSMNFIPTVANMINVLIQVVVSYPAMRFWIMPSQT